ncbi:hypothetical protein [Streptomyces sp. ID05-47C]|uniref:hypothetical protein n=1 Tax=Streptomyces sp. ID05-47C TaxID=3028665 RepID=UPI0029B64835|nr:hypothetical protein [Streptomyces sp. ID05-47C]MDX3570799.1 hypothetical protein [Streptomyces sp. ID05-47C]
MSRRINVRYHGPDPIEGAEHLQLLEVYFVPVEYPQIVVHWDYVVQDGEIAFPSGMRIEPWPALPVNDRLHVGASFVRDLPTAKLERAARMAAEMMLSQGKAAVREKLKGTHSPAGDPEEIQETARAMVRERWPDLDPETGAGAARRWNRLVRLAEVVQEHQAARARGEKAPASAVAQARGVEPGTVRTWLHQAKQEGIAARLVPVGTFMTEVISDIHPDGVIGEDG